MCHISSSLRLGLSHLVVTVGVGDPVVSAGRARRARCEASGRACFPPRTSCAVGAAIVPRGQGVVVLVVLPSGAVGTEGLGDNIRVTVLAAGTDGANDPVRSVSSHRAEGTVANAVRAGIGLLAIGAVITRGVRRVLPRTALRASDEPRARRHPTRIALGARAGASGSREEASIASDASGLSDTSLVTVGLARTALRALSHIIVFRSEVSTVDIVRS